MDTGQARDLDTTSGKRRSPDRATLMRVAAALRCQLDGEAIPAAPPFTGPTVELERRTSTPLAPIYAKRRL
jgi:hypothetical protein